MSYITPADLVSLGYDLSNMTSDVQQEICDRASEMIDNEANQPFARTHSVEYQVLYVSGNLFKIFPDNLPVLAVNSATVLGEDGSTVSLNNPVLNNQGGFVFYFDSSICVSRNAMVQIDYDHGYDVIPADVVQATKLTADVLIGEWMVTNQTGLNNVLQVRDGQRQVNRQSSMATVPQGAKDILNNVRRIR